MKYTCILNIIEFNGITAIYDLRVDSVQMDAVISSIRI